MSSNCTRDALEKNSLENRAPILYREKEIIPRQPTSAAFAQIYITKPSRAILIPAAIFHLNTIITCRKVLHLKRLYQILCVVVSFNLRTVREIALFISSRMENDLGPGWVTHWGDYILHKLRFCAKASDVRDNVCKSRSLVLNVTFLPEYHIGQ